MVVRLLHAALKNVCDAKLLGGLLPEVIEDVLELVAEAAVLAGALAGGQVDEEELFGVGDVALVEGADEPDQLGAELDDVPAVAVQPGEDPVGQEVLVAADLEGLASGVLGVVPAAAGVEDLGAGGVERIVEIPLQPDEKAAFDKSCAAVRDLIEAFKKLGV